MPTKLNFKSHWLGRYGFALVAVAAAFLLREGLTRLAGGDLPPYITFYPAVMLSALLGGVGPGLLATVLTALGVDYFILPPIGTFTIAALPDAVGMAFFTGMGVFMSVIAELYRRARQEAAAHDTEVLLREGREAAPRWSKQGLLLYGGLAASLAILAVAGWQCARNLRAAAEADKWENHTYVVIQELERLLSAVKDTETGKRGYLLTGEEKYLEPYQAALGLVQTNLAGLKQLTADKAGQQQRLAGIEALIREKLAEEQQTIELRRTQALPAALAVVTTDKGKVFMDEIRKRVAEAQNEEGRLLQERTAAKNADAGKTLQALLASGVLTFLLLITVFLFLKQENARRTEAEAEVRHHRDHLQEIVAARTAELRESEERLRLLVDGTKDCALFMLDPQGQIASWNEGARWLKGYESEEVIGQHFSLFYTPEEVTAGKPARELETAQREGKYEEEGERVRKDGSRFWASVLISPLWDEQGRLHGFSKLIRDITERRRAQEALLESEARLASMVGSAMDAILSVDAEQRIVLFNAAAERTFGCSATAALGQPLDRFIPERLRARHRQHVQEFGNTGVSSRTMGRLGDLTGLRADGKEFPIEASISQGEVRGRKLFTVILRDITERKRAEAAIARLASFPELNVNPIVELDQDGQVGYANPEARRLFPELPGRGLEHPWLAGLETLGRTLQAGETRSAVREVTVGDRAWQQTVHYVPEIKRLRIYASDITERKRAEETLRQVAEDLKRSNHDLEQFAYVASHDLQEPLRAVGGYVKLLQLRFPAQLDAKAQHYIAGAFEGATRMEQLITDLLAFSRVGTRGGAFIPTELDAVLSQALRNLQAGIESAQATVTHDPLPTLSVDATQITQLLQNLIGNALKFHDDQPPKIHIGARREEGRWVFSVRDNGIGIEPQYYEKIFQIFQRLHTRKDYSGTGIGLAICKKIVERHGGTIWVESQPGQGSTFYFSIPEAASGG